MLGCIVYRRKRFYAQAGLAVASTSMHVLWPSVALRNILNGDSPLDKNLTDEEISWIIMSLFLGTIPGAMTSGLMLEKSGRKIPLLVLTALLFLVWFPLAFTSSIVLLCIGRFLAGFAISAIIIITTVYNGEIANKYIRGRIGATLNCFVLFGEFLVACIGPFASYTVFALTSCVLPLISVVLIYFMPESPYYLVKKAKKEEAEQQLQKLMSSTTSGYDMSTALKDIEAETRNKSSVWGIFGDPVYRKSLIIIIGIKLVQQLSGSSAFGEFTNTVIEATHSNITKQTWKIILTAMSFFGALLSGVLVDKIGRKPLIIVSLVGCTIALIAEGVCSMLYEQLATDIQQVSWLATTSLVVYVIVRPLGIGTLPYVLMSELFASNIKHHAVAVCGTVNAIIGFIMLKYFSKVTDLHVLFIAFWIFAGVCVLGSLFVYFVMPETKCKTFSEIQGAMDARKGNFRQPYPG